MCTKWGFIANQKTRKLLYVWPRYIEPSHHTTRVCCIDCVDLCFFLSVAWYIIDMQRSLLVYDGMSHLSQEKMRCLSLAFMHLSMSSPRGGGGSGNSREFDHDAYPQGGDFDLTSCIWSLNFKEWMRSKPFVSANFDNFSLPGGGDFDNFS